MRSFSFLHEHQVFDNPVGDLLLVVMTMIFIEFDDAFVLAICLYIVYSIDRINFFFLSNL